MSARPHARIVSTRPSDGRIKIDFGTLPGWWPLLLGGAIAVLVGGLALLVGEPNPDTGSVAVGMVVGVAALAVIAFAAARHR